MSQDNRNIPRYSDYARINAPSICIFPGILVDISQTGIQVRFPVSVDLSTEEDYEISVLPTRKSGMAQFKLIVHPVWVQHTEGAVSVGFKVLRSPGTREMEKYVAILKNSSADQDDIALVEACLSS